MTSRLPRVAAATAGASLPPANLPGLNPIFSQLVPVPDVAAGVDRIWHVLDNGPQLAELGAEPVGTILCVHGNPTWSYLWRSLFSAAMDAAIAGLPAWRVVAVDQLDMGFSERTGIARTLAVRVRDLAALTVALHVDGPVVTLGHDWGGVVSLGWAIDHPDQLAGVMLLNTAVHQPEDYPVPAPLRIALRRGVLGTATVLTPAFLETTLALAHPPLPSAVKDAYRAPYRTAARRGGIGAFVADIPVDASHPSTPELDRIAAGVSTLAVPALMLWGPRDPIFSDRYLADLVHRMPHADVHRFEGAGHLIAEDVDFAAAALTWLGERVHPVVEPVPVIEPVETSGTNDGVEVSTSSTPGVEVSTSSTPGVEVSTSSTPGGEVSTSSTTGVEVSTSSTPGGEVSTSSTTAGSTPAARPLWATLDEMRDSDEVALVEMVPPTGTGPRVVSWKLLSRRVRQIAAGLVRVGVKKGDRVSLLVPPGADLTAVLYACVRIGAVVVVADAGLGVRGLTRAVRGAWPHHIIGATPGLIAARALGWPGQRISVVRYPEATGRALGLSHALADIVELGSDELLPDPPAPDDPAAVLFTSGSTGPAKGVVYTHAQLSAVVAALSVQYGIGVGTGLVAGFAPFALLGPALGARSVTPDMNVTSPKTLTATAVAAAVAAVDATIVFLSPSAIANVVATENDLTPADRAALRGVQTFLSAGAPVSERLLSAASDLMPNATAHTPYGMTEGLLMTDITLPGIRQASRSDVGVGGVCVGMPAATTRVRISALETSPIDGSAIAPGEPSETPGITGEIVVSAPHVKDHYDQLWLTDRISKLGSVAGERWHRTGDVGHLDSTGRLWVEGRLPHVITTASGLMTPVGPEQLVESVAAVARAAVVGVGPNGNQQLVAVVETTSPAHRVQLAPPVLAAAIRAAVGSPIAAVIVVPHLPTDIRHNSKIDRRLLSRWAAGILSGGRMSRP